MSEAMMSLQQAHTWIPGSRLAGDAAVRPLRVHTDTRSLAAGDLFVALRGERFDGADYLVQAREAGAVAAVCEDAAEARLAASGLPGLLVPDARRALAQLASAWRARFELPLIAVTGSNGKTTVTQMIAAILRAWQSEAALATQGNLNNDIGVPLTVLRLRIAHRAAVVELGMNHPGEIAHLAAIAQPTVALVNNAQREHLEFMGSVEAVARENGSVIDALRADGTAVIPADDAYTALWQAAAGERRLVRFTDADGVDADVSVQGDWCDGAWAVTLHTPAGRAALTLHMAGRHNLRNAAAAAACALAAGVPLEAVRAGLEAFEPVKGRSRVHVLREGGQPLTLVDDSYNANPDSVRAAIAMLAALPAPRLLVLGDMGEVGEQGPAFHAEALALARSSGIEHVHVLGAQCVRAAQAQSGVVAHADIDSLLAAVTGLRAQVRSLLVKGSRFMRMERVVEAVLAAAPCPMPSGDDHVA
ncbi:MAG: UDP-N-acetylmuramoyl-tripeptide--D-alanyl-D-alanine ligase [Tibeticola sp.]